jgi:amino acid transporter
MSYENGGDPEKNLKGAVISPETGSSPEQADWGVGAAPKEPWTRRFIDSFKRDPNAMVSKGAQVSIAKGEFDHRAAAEATANSGLAHTLKGRHLQMIAIGGSIGEFPPISPELSQISKVGILTALPGTGLFVTSGAALSTGGPASLVIAFCIIGILMFCTVQALGELAVLFPVAGSFSAYSTRFIDPAWGFAMGWK